VSLSLPSVRGARPRFVAARCLPTSEDRAVRGSVGFTEAGVKRCAVLLGTPRNLPIMGEPRRVEDRLNAQAVRHAFRTINRGLLGRPRANASPVLERSTS
jgi:hypothetical protein